MIQKRVNSRGAMRGYSIAERFWAKVVKLSNAECWLWTAFVDQDGYGKLQVGRAAVAASRISWELNFGMIPDGKLVCHKCDTPRCVNPNHLFLGTNVDNTTDRDAKGRQARGDTNGWSKLSAEKVLEIRARYVRGRTRQVDLATEFKVDQTAISAVIPKQTWRHV